MRDAGVRGDKMLAKAQPAMTAVSMRGPWWRRGKCACVHVTHRLARAQIVRFLGLVDVARLCATCTTFRAHVRTSAQDTWIDLYTLGLAWTLALDLDRTIYGRRFQSRPTEPPLRIQSELAVQHCARLGRVRAVECLVGMRERKRAPARTLATFKQNPRGWKADASLWTWAVRGAARAGLVKDVKHYQSKAIAERERADSRLFCNKGNALYYKGMADLYACCKGYVDGGHLALLCGELCRANVTSLLEGKSSLVRCMLLRRYRVRLSVLNELLLIANKSYTSILSFLVDVYIGSFTAR